MKLRKWQRDCISQAYSQYSTGNDHFLCHATPGAGKTIMASQLAKKLFESNLIDHMGSDFVMKDGCLTFELLEVK